MTCAMCGGEMAPGDALLCAICRGDLRSRVAAQLPRSEVPNIVVLGISRAVLSSLTLALGIASENARGLGDNGLASQFIAVANLLHQDDPNWTVVTDPAVPVWVEREPGVKPS